MCVLSVLFGGTLGLVWAVYSVCGPSEVQMRRVVITREFARLDISFFQYALVVVVLGVRGHRHDGATSYRTNFCSSRRSYTYGYCH